MNFSILQAMSKVVGNSCLTTFMRRFPRVKYLHTYIKYLTRQSPRNYSLHVKCGSLVFATVGAAVYYSQLTNHEKRMLRVSLGGIGRFLRFVPLFLPISWFVVAGKLLHSQIWDFHSGDYECGCISLPTCLLTPSSGRCWWRQQARQKHQ